MHFRGVLASSILDGTVASDLPSYTKLCRGKALALARGFRSKLHGRNME